MLVCVNQVAHKLLKDARIVFEEVYNHQIFHLDDEIDC